MYLLFDIGATNLRVAISTDGRRFRPPVIVKTPAKFADGMATIKTVALRLANGKKIKRAVGGAAGLFDKSKARLLNSNLKEWRHQPLKNRLQAVLHAPVMLENDAALAALGEACHGAGKGYGIVAYLTISSGVGGARIVNREIDRNALGFEPGHQFINISGKYKTVEELISGLALHKRFGRPATQIKTAKAWREIMYYSAAAITNVTALWSPDVVVVGGAVAANPRLKLSGVKHQLATLDPFFGVFPPLKKAALGTVGGLYGALELVRRGYR